ncbi:MAG: protein-glutamate O-methyltransferase CheR [Candidatus Omnitrophota bacterium]
MEEEKFTGSGNIKELDLKNVIEYIRTKRGVDLLNSYRSTFVFRRLRIRMREVKALNYAEYTDIIEKDPKEFNKFLDVLSINVTEFFRDKEVFDAFRNIILPGIIKNKESNKENIIRVWSAGCASGQEPYSLAIILKEALADKKDFLIRITATDIDSLALENADKAEYNISDFKEIDNKILEKYFTLAYNGCYKLNDEIKNMVLFRRNNLISEPPLHFIDVIFCRNVLIYFKREQQDLIFQKFNQALNRQGFLVIGKTEMIWSKDLFAAVNTRQKIYQKL